MLLQTMLNEIKSTHILSTKSISFAFLTFIFISLIAFPCFAKWHYYKWPYKGKLQSFSFDSLDDDYCYKNYRSISVNHQGDNYPKFVLEDPCYANMEIIAGRLIEITRTLGLSKLESVNYIISWVRSTVYNYDTDTKYLSDYVRYPFELILDKTGDCEDFAVLFASIMSHWCIRTKLVFLNTAAGYHVANIINTSDFPDTFLQTIITIHGDKYSYVEATGCKKEDQPCGIINVGDLPAFNGQVVKESDLLNFYDLPLVCNYDPNVSYNSGNQMNSSQSSTVEVESDWIIEDGLFKIYRPDI
ncbi:MAG: transglutaminase-like domain-containing protein [Pseudomonadota bacterium]